MTVDNDRVKLMVDIALKNDFEAVKNYINNIEKEELRSFTRKSIGKVISKGYLDMFKLLMSKGLFNDEQSLSLMMKNAVSEGHVDFVDYIINQFNLDYKKELTAYINISLYSDNEKMIRYVFDNNDKDELLNAISNITENVQKQKAMIFFESYYLNQTLEDSKSNKAIKI